MKWFYLANAANALDAVTTLLFVHLGIAEGNPVMDFLLQIHPVAFLIFKLGIGAVGAAYCVFAYKKYPLILATIAFTLCSMVNLFCILKETGLL